MSKIIAECKKEDPEISLVIANGENAAHGMGITKGVLEEILSAGVDLVTLGDHTWDIKGAVDLLEKKDIPVICPANFPKLTLDKGFRILDVGKEKILVINLIGRVFMKIYPDCPFRAVDEILKKCENKAKVIIVDFHGEATSEKNALGHYLAGRVSAVLGTHTHIQTADERIMKNGTAYISDVGMVGPLDSIIGGDKDVILEQSLTQVPFKYQLSSDENVLANAVVLDIDEKTGKARGIKRVSKVLKSDGCIKKETGK